MVEDGDVGLRRPSNLGALKALCNSATAVCTSLIAQQKIQVVPSVAMSQVNNLSSECVCAVKSEDYIPPFPLLSCVVNTDPLPTGSPAGERKGVSPSGELLRHPLPPLPGKRREEFRQFLAKDRALTPHQLIRAVPEGFILASGLQ